MASASSLRASAAGSFAPVQDLILPVGIIASVLVIMVPLPSGLMDVLLAANITVAVIMLLTTIYVRTPLEFSIFPSLLLATTGMTWRRSGRWSRTVKVPSGRSRTGSPRNVTWASRWVAP